MERRSAARIDPLTHEAPGLGAPPELLVASYNVHKGVGLDMRRDPARIARVIGEIAPNVIALQEADRRFGDRAGVLDLDALKDLAGLEPVMLPTRRGRLSHGWHGNVVLLRDAEVEDVRPIDLPGLEPRGAVMVDLRIGDAPLRVIAAHLGLLKGSRLLQARALVAAQAGADDRPTILLGDLNEWRRGPGCSLTPLRDHYGAEGAMVASFPARRPMLPLDRIFACSRAEVVDIEPHMSPLSRIASDHLPVKARLRLRP
ncbi:endonuclease/exonuclease/phosphatase family protein [Halodurantibacterium flavum]|uniref:Endonuclease/exonuclease/phosphatase family protein n=1 Tax=Halodurantibacterium flavum TaxID=1382802 RepID=A0ABW4SA24_9RHOB